MKVNLLLAGKDNIRSGYLNIDPLCKEKTEEYVNGDFGNLDDLVCDGEAEEIVALNIINYFKKLESIHIIQHLLDKLSHQGILTISFVNIQMLARKIILEDLSDSDIQESLYGKQRRIFDTIYCSISIPEIKELIPSQFFIKSICHQKLDTVVTIQRK